MPIAPLNARHICSHSFLLCLLLNCLWVSSLASSSHFPSKSLSLLRVRSIHLKIDDIWIIVSFCLCYSADLWLIRRPNLTGTNTVIISRLVSWPMECESHLRVTGKQGQSELIISQPAGFVSHRSNKGHSADVCVASRKHSKKRMTHSLLCKKCSLNCCELHNNKHFLLFSSLIIWDHKIIFSF